LVLAGVEIALPNISPEHIHDLLQLKETYPEEMGDYQAYIAELLSGTWEFIKSDPSLDEVI